MTITERLKSDLVTAMRERDQVRVSTIRSLISAIDNAGAVPVAGQGYDYDPKIGLGHDIDRLHLTTDDVERIIAAERDELVMARDEYRGLGKADLAAEFDRRVEISASYLSLLNTPSLRPVTHKPLGAILTGGRSTRMGRDKADVEVGGETMLSLVSRALAPCVSRTVLLGSDRDGWETWPDAVHAAGPLAGIATALNRATSDRVVLLAVDQPFARTTTLEKMIDIESDLPVVPVDATGARQVTFAVYPTSIAAAATSEAQGGGSIQTLLDTVSFRPVAPDEWRSWGEDGRSWFSVDSEDDLAAGLARFGS